MHKNLPRRATPFRELHFLDTAQAYTVPTVFNQPASSCLNVIPQDDTQSGRTGRKVVVESIHFHGMVAFTGTGVALVQSTYCDFYIVQDTQANGANPTIVGANTGFVTTNNINTMQRTLANVNRYRVLKKIRVLCDPTAGAGTVGTIQVPFDAYIRCKIPIEYDASAATGAIGTIRSNNIFLCSGQSGTSDMTVEVVGNVRIRFEG